MQEVNSDFSIPRLHRTVSGLKLNLELVFGGLFTFRISGVRILSDAGYGLMSMDGIGCPMNHLVG
jgi:hypothetical protein